MPINQVVSNESTKEMRRPAEQMLRLLQPAKGTLHMAKTPTFCRYPEDLNGCRQSLTRAWREGSVGECCIMEGLRADWHQCRQVLLEGLKNKTSPHKDTDGLTATGKENNGVDEACKAVVHLGYPLEIKAVQETFYEAYFKLVRSQIYKFGLRDDGDPSANDVFQNVFANLHKQFRSRASVKGPLAAYVARVTVNECFRGLRNTPRHVTLAEDQVQIGTSRSSALLAPAVVENWEHLDRQLHSSDQGNLINRIILAQQCMEACCTGKKPSARQLHADWQILSQMSKRSTASLHKKVVMHVKRSPESGLVHIVADVLNAGPAKPYQAAVIFAAGMGWDIEQTYRLLGELCSLSDTAIYARICRIYVVLKPPGMEKQ